MKYMQRCMCVCLSGRSGDSCVVLRSMSEKKQRLMLAKTRWANTKADAWTPLYVVREVVTYAF